MERLGSCFRFVIRFGPNSLEVNGVGQDQPGKVVEAAGWQDILDLVFGRVRYPTVDLPPGGVRSGLKVSLVEVGLISAVGYFQKSGQERTAFLGPQGVGDA